MLRRLLRRERPAPEWSRQKMLALVIGAAAAAVVLVAGLVLAIVYAAHPARHTSATGTATAAGAGHGPGPSSAAAAAAPGQSSAGGGDARDALAAKAMSTVPESASHPGPISTLDPGPPIVLPKATSTGPAGVPTGFPHTPEGAMAQMAAIDQIALQSGSLSGSRAVITGWAQPGGPTTANWSGVKAMGTLLDAAGLSGGGSGQLAMLVTPLMGQIKGSIGPDFVIPCVDFEIDVTLTQTARGATSDCQRMVWTGERWMIGPGAEPAAAPSVWPDTDAAISVGYRDLRHG